MQEGVHIGVDVGTERTGLAISDEYGRMALPLETVEAARAAQRIVALIDERDGIAIVVGWPLDMTGTAGRAVRRVEKFLKQLDLALEDREVAVHTFDERLTTAAADQILRQTNISRRKRNQVVDQVAATQILQDYLDASQNS